jgi:hypothetical protein
VGKFVEQKKVLRKMRKNGKTEKTNKSCTNLDDKKVEIRRKSKGEFLFEELESAFWSKSYYVSGNFVGF